MAKYKLTKEQKEYFKRIHEAVKKNKTRIKEGSYKFDKTGPILGGGPKKDTTVWKNITEGIGMDQFKKKKKKKNAKNSR